MKREYWYPLSLFVIALLMNFYTVAASDFRSPLLDVSVDIRYSETAYVVGWHPEQMLGQTNTSFLVGWLVPQAAHLLQTDVVSVYRNILPVIYSLTTPLLYFLYRKWLTPAQSFLGALFFVLLPPSWQEVPTRGKSMLAEPLAVVTLLVLFRGGDDRLRVLLGSVFVVMAIWSHYTVGVMLLIWLGVILVCSLRRTQVAIVLAVGVVFFLAYFVWADRGGILTQLRMWVMGELPPHLTDRLTSTLVPSMSAASIPSGTNYTLNTASLGQLWFIRFVLFLNVAVLLCGLWVMVSKNRILTKYPDLSAWLCVAGALIVCAIIVPFFTVGLFLSGWIQLGAMALSLCFGASSEALSRWVSVPILASLVLVAVL